MSYTADHLAW